MKRQISRKVPTVQRAVNSKKIARPKPRVAKGKLDQSALMTNYLIEEHPELGK
jgi:hypothetical protein